MKLLFPIVVPTGVALAVLAYEIQVSSLDSSDARAVAHVAIGLSFLLAGLIAWSRRPANRLGSLMVAAGFALLLRQLRYSNDSLAFTVFFLLGDLGYALVAHSVLVYPSGHVTDRVERAFVRVVYAAVLVFPLAVLLLHGEGDRLLQFGSLDRKSDIVVVGDEGAVEALQKTYIAVFFGALAAVFLVLLGRRLLQATPQARRKVAPLGLAAVAVTLLALYECIYAFADQRFASTYLFWGYVAAFLALPPALLVGLLRTRARRATVGDLVVQLEQTPPEGLRDALARGLGDPTLEVAFWLPERRGFADAEGRRVVLPADGAGQAVTRLEHGGEPLAVLIHDPALRDEPELIEAATAAARLALENARLSAELRAQLEKVNESRARIVSAGDAERRRIERDIHDGAQQRLVALALELRSAQLRARETGDAEVEQLLASAVDDLQAAVHELRELARGVHPAILTEEGLAAALESLVLRASIPVDLEEAPELRLAPEVEATAYFVACEGLVNIVKHAGASTATLSARRQDGLLVVEIVDDGVGGAELGSGLRGLTDRVEALGGRLRVVSSPAEGTRIVAEIPCAS